jgi:uncharacterized protein YnzC (UPF0291/DUF896 family)
MNTTYYDIHPLANIVAMAGEREQTALTQDILRNGQNEPAVLWRGKIVDGRCRQLACTTLDIPLETRELDAKLTEDEVAKVVKSLNTRRNLTETQKLASAYLEQNRTGRTNKEVASEWAISVRSLQNFKYIAQFRPELVQPLFNGDSVAIIDPDKGYKVTTNKVNTLARIVKLEQEAGKVEVVKPSQIESIEYSVTGAISTEVGRAEHRDLVKAYKHSASKEEMFSAMAAELMNYKYQVSE